MVLAFVIACGVASLVTCIRIYHVMLDVLVVVLGLQTLTA